MSTLPLRQILGGRYRLDRVVSESAGATVFEAFHLTLGVKVAVKVVRRSALDREAIAREVEALKQITSEHVVRPIDVGLARIEASTEVPFLALEWCDAGSLTDVRTRRFGGRLEAAQAVELMLPVVDALGAVHRAGITHGDIKPSNILFVTTAGGALSPRVIDFGSAATFGRSGTGDFSAPYAAPEQVRGGAVGPFTDVHALALVLTELVVGAQPYGELGAIAAVDEARPTPARFGVDCGPIEAVLAKALSLDEKARPRDADELARELREATRSSATDPTGSGAGASARHPRPRRALLAGVAAGTIGAAALALWGWRSSTRGGRGETASTPRRAAPSLAPTAAELLEHARSQATASGYEPTALSAPERVSLSRGGALWTVDVREPDVVQVDDRGAAMRRAIAEIVWDYRDADITMMYGLIGPRLLVVSGPIHPAPIRAVFEDLTAGLAFELVGEALSMEEPTTREAGSTSSAVRSATSIHELSLGELVQRVRDAGATIEFHSRPRVGVVYAKLGSALGQCEIVGGRGGGDEDLASQRVEAMRSDHVSFLIALDGEAAVYSTGAPPFLDPAFLERVVSGLGATVRRG